MLSEDRIIHNYFRTAGAERSDVCVGIGDDAAVLEPPPGRNLVAAVDTLNEGVHFPAATQPAAIGHRALAVNLSDLAAMGAEPAWATLSLCLPAPDEAWLEGFADGFRALARQHGVALVGGDTTRGPLSVSVQLLGWLRPGEALTRAGAKPGDGVYVTGHLGGAAAGLRLLIEGRASTSEPLTRAFLWPEPRVAIGQDLCGLASAAIDLSDGLGTDLPRLLAASGAGASLDPEQLPLAPAALALLGASAAREGALAGGDDYELCFTVPAEAEDELAARAVNWSTPVTRIGCVEASPGLRFSGEAELAKLPEGWRHFEEKGS